MKFLNYLHTTIPMIAGIAAYFSVVRYGYLLVLASIHNSYDEALLGKIVTAYVHLFWDKLNYMKYYLAFSC